LSERHHADRNVALAYNMRQNHAFDGYPTPSQIQDHLDLYFQTCSITASVRGVYIERELGSCTVMIFNSLDIGVYTYKTNRVNPHIYIYIYIYN